MSDKGSYNDAHGTEVNTERLRHAREELASLYNTEEVYWMQRSCIKLLCKGDRNRRFFHVHASHRTRTNHIMGLVDCEGRWTNDNKGICNVARGYFVDLFKIELMPSKY